VGGWFGRVYSATSKKATISTWRPGTGKDGTKEELAIRKADIKDDVFRIDDGVAVEEGKWVIQQIRARAEWKKTLDSSTMVDQWIGLCAVCYTTGWPIGSCKHTTHRSEHQASKDDQRGNREDASQAEGGSNCFRCALPFKMCARRRKDKEKEKENGRRKIMARVKSQSPYLVNDVVALIVCLK